MWRRISVFKAVVKPTYMYVINVYTCFIININKS